MEMEHKYDQGPSKNVVVSESNCKNTSGCGLAGGIMVDFFNRLHCYMLTQQKINANLNSRGHSS